jgi:UDP-N-acetylglucosamine 4-epimerase
MKFLITGGSGFIGSNLAEYLLRQGHSVRVLDDYSTGRKENLSGLSGDLEIIEGTMQSPEICQKACKDIDAISHQAAFGSVPRSIRNPELYSSNNLHGFVTLANAARKAGIKRVVYASSSSVYGDLQVSPKVEGNTGRPLSPYAASKQAKEAFAHSFANVYNMTFVGLRYFNVFGPRQNPEGAYAAVIPLFINKLLAGQSPDIHGQGDQSRDFTFIDNVVQANVNALTHDIAQDSHILNIACGFSTSVNDLYKQIASIIGSDIKPNYVDARAGDVKNSLADVSLAAKLVGYTPRVQIDEGLKQTVAWYKAAQK